MSGNVGIYRYGPAKSRGSEGTGEEVRRPRRDGRHGLGRAAGAGPGSAGSCGTGTSGVTMAEVSPVRKRPPAGRFEIPDGWVARGFEFEVEWPGGAGAVSKIWSHFGARRKAYNWALGQVKADLDARRADPGHVAVPWNLYALRKRWNAEKAVVAPWWAENSKEAYATGIADLCAALKNWSDSRAGQRQGRKVGFPT